VDGFEPGSQPTSIAAAARGKISLRNAATDKWPAATRGRKAGKVRGRGRNISGEKHICTKATIARVVQRKSKGEDNFPADLFGRKNCAELPRLFMPAQPAHPEQVQEMVVRRGTVLSCR